MDQSFLASLLGPFPMTTPPTRRGFYAVDLGSEHIEMWHWSVAADEWSDSDDGLGDPKDPAQARGWYGQRPSRPAESDDLEEGLDDATQGSTQDD